MVRVGNITIGRKSSMSEYQALNYDQIDKAQQKIEATYAIIEKSFADIKAKIATRRANILQAIQQEQIVESSHLQAITKALNGLLENPELQNQQPQQPQQPRPPGYQV